MPEGTALARSVRAKTTSRGLVHLCGFPSGGTTLFRNFLNSHEDVDIADELPLLPRLASRFGAEVEAPRAPELVAELLRLDVYNSFRNRQPDLAGTARNGAVPVAQVYRAMASERDVPWTGNKTPQNTESIRHLLRLFPDSKFILILRDVRDVCLSWRRKWGRDIYSCAHRWQGRMLKGLDDLAALPEGRGTVVKYEELLTEPEKVALHLCDFLDLRFSERMLRFHEHMTKTIDGKRKDGQPIDPTNFGKWARLLSTAEATRIEEIAFEAMRRTGYAPAFATSPRPITALEQCKGLAHDVTAMIVVGNRYARRNALRDRLGSLTVTMRRCFAPR